MATFVITFFNEDLPVGRTTVSKTKTLHVSNLKKAILEWDVTIRQFITGGFKSIRFNGQEVSKAPNGSMDVTEDTIEEGANVVELQYDNPQSFPWENAGHAYVVLRVDSEQVTEEEPFKIPEIPWYIWLIIALIVIALIIYLASRLLHKAPVEVVKEVVKEVKGAVT